MTIKAFWEDPYLTEIETTVTGVEGNDITVDQTIFYALSGGQESDYGSINNHPVIQARKEDREIVYTLEDGHELAPDDRVKMTIDWERRYQLMRLHFAAEIVLELFYRKLKGVEKIGAHIGEDKARIDFLWQENISYLLPEIRQEALKLIESNQEIVSAFSDERAEKRYWKVNSFARVPCGGTHLKRIGEVGNILLKRNNIGKGKERVEISLDEATAN